MNHRLYPKYKTFLPSSIACVQCSSNWTQKKDKPGVVTQAFDPSKADAGKPELDDIASEESQGHTVRACLKGTKEKGKTHRAGMRITRQHRDSISSILHLWGLFTDMIAAIMKGSELTFHLLTKYILTSLMYPNYNTRNCITKWKKKGRKIINLEKRKKE